MNEPELSVSQFVAVFNQTLELAYPSVVILGELANFRVSKNRWVYFDLKDELSSLKFFGSVYNLPGPLSDGLMLKVRAQPQLHPNYGFSMKIFNIQLYGEGSIKKAAELLKAKLANEGLFETSRKRLLPYPPHTVGLITSRQSAAYSDFIKIINARWRGITIQLVDVQVQGEAAPGQIVSALEQFNAEATPPEVVVLIRGGGSSEDLAAFSSEAVTRAVAASRVPTLVAIGHEIDVSLAELAADKRASTPSNAAELLVPDRRHLRNELKVLKRHITQSTGHHIESEKQSLANCLVVLADRVSLQLRAASANINVQRRFLEAYNPAATLKRGYAIVRREGKLVRTASQLKLADIVEVSLSKGSFKADVNQIDQGN